MADSSKTPLSFEDNLAQLDNIVKQLEQGELPLNKSIELYQQGQKLAKQCQQTLAELESQIKPDTN